MSIKGEVKNIDINIVGMLSDADEISELIDVAKVFVIEERVKNISNETILPKVIKSIKEEKILKTNISQKMRYLANLTVKGLN